MISSFGPGIDYADLPRVRDIHQDQKIVFCSGAFDILHPGHLFFFEQCKSYGDILVVEVAHDRLIAKHKGSKRPILPEAARLKMVSGQKPVDYCFLDVPVEGYPLSFFETVFKLLKPDRYVVNKDAFDMPYRKELAGRHGVELVTIDLWYKPDEIQISTSWIIEQIKQKCLQGPKI